MRRASVLRISGKVDLETMDIVRDEPKFLHYYPEKVMNMDAPVSKAHAYLYQQLFGVPLLPYRNMDNQLDIEYVGYKTRK